MTAESRVVLASGSPRRRQLLRQAGIDFDWQDPGHDGPSESDDPAGRVLAHARHKARAVARGRPGRFVLAADTLVWLDGAPLGKPAGVAIARAMLSGLAGREHEVWTGVCLIAPDGQLGERADCARVAFGRPPEDAVERYLAGEEWRDKAGAYAIQGWAAEWARVVAGDVETVIGLRTRTVCELLRAAGACLRAPSG